MNKPKKFSRLVWFYVSFSPRPVSISLTAFVRLVTDVQGVETGKFTIRLQVNDAMIFMV